MQNFAQVDRKIIPRWRSLIRTPGKELQSCREPQNIKIDETPLKDRLFSLYKNWREKPTLENASEVIDAAVFVEDRDIAIGPAKMIFESELTSKAAKDVAQFVIKGPTLSKEAEIPEAISRQHKATRILAIKTRLVNEPGNALLWLEKARLHTTFNEENNAELALRRAFGAAPNNRFILRAYSRFLVHKERPDEAHKILVRSQAIKEDPWVQAAEISIAEMIDKSPQSIRKARQIIERGHLAPQHQSELLGAIATLELDAGKAKMAKRLFNKSFLGANENSLAQALWAMEERKLPVEFKAKYLRWDNAYEARVKNAVTNKEWETAINACSQWLNDEAFSVGAAVEGSYISSGYKFDEEQALAFCDRGLIANPNSKALLNNKAVALCRLGRLKDAEPIIQDLSQYIRHEPYDPVILATTGLYHYALGQKEIGAQFYDMSVDAALDQGMLETAFRARFHWFYEAAHASQINPDDMDRFMLQLDNNAIKEKLHTTTVDMWERTKVRIDKKVIGQGLPTQTHINLFKNTTG